MHLDLEQRAIMLLDTLIYKKINTHTHKIENNKNNKSNSRVYLSAFHCCVMNKRIPSLFARLNP